MVRLSWKGVLEDCRKRTVHKFLGYRKMLQNVRTEIGVEMSMIGLMACEVPSNTPVLSFYMEAGKVGGYGSQGNGDSLHCAKSGHFNPFYMFNMDKIFSSKVMSHLCNSMREAREFLGASHPGAHV